MNLHQEIQFRIDVLQVLGVLKVSKRKLGLWAAGSVIQVLSQDDDLLKLWLADCKTKVTRFGKQWYKDMKSLAKFIRSGYGLDYIQVKDGVDPELNRIEKITSYMRRR